MSKITIGALELVNLPDLEIKDLQTRVDTGAKTSSLHVDNIVLSKIKSKPYVQFDIHPDIHNVDKIKQCKAAIHDIRRIKSSNGEIDQRYIILTTLQIADKQWQIELSLSNRSDMSNLMLLGRQGMADRVLVDPSQTYMVSNDSE